MDAFGFFIKRPQLVNFMFVFIMAAGILSILTIRRDLFPNVNYDIVVVTTRYEGATPEDIEKLITIPLEKELWEVDGIDEMTSSSIENLSIIVLKLDADVKNKDKVINDIQRAVDSAEDLPHDLKDKPVVRDVKSKDMPIITVSLSGNVSENELRTYAKVLEDRLLDLPEVSKVAKEGYRDEEIWVEVDPQKMRSYHIGLGEVMSALARENLTIPGGRVISGTREYLIRTAKELNTKEDVAGVIIRANEEGNWVRVGDIANVKDGFEEEETITKTNGKMALNLTVIKKEKADALRLVEKISKVADEYRKEIGGKIEINLVNDHSYYLKRRLNVLIQNGLMGFALVIISLILLLNLGAAFFTALGIPTAFAATFFIMKLAGISIDLISLFGLIMVLGMLVDDAIVVSENTFSYIEKGIPYKEAALRGVREVWRPITSSITTTIVAFLPLMFMGGIIGKFISEMPFIVVIALSSSLFEAFFMLPSHIAELERLPWVSKVRFRWAYEMFSSVSEWYGTVLHGFIKRRYRVIAISLLALIAAFILLYKFLLPPILFPARGIDNFFVRGKLPIGTPLEQTEAKFRKIEEIIASAVPKGEIDNFITTIGETADHPNDPSYRIATHVGQIRVVLKPSVDRKMEAREIIELIKRKVHEEGADEGFEEMSYDEMKAGPPIGAPVSVRIKGDDLEKLSMLASEIKEALLSINGVEDVRVDYELGKGELKVLVDEEKASRAHVAIEDIASAVRYAYSGGVATKIKRTDEEVLVRVRFPYEVKYNEGMLGEVMVENKGGGLVPLKEIASFERTGGASAINHLNRKRVVTISANVRGEEAKPLAVARIIRDRFKDAGKRYPGCYISFGGEYKETEESLSNLWHALILALILIFAIIATEFKSAIQTLIIMVSIPFGFVGVIVAFILHHQPLSFVGLIGAVGLAGVVVNNAILLIEFIDRYLEEGVDVIQAIVEAGKRRLRPIFLTTGTTVLGLVSLAYGIWGSDPILIPAALAMMWGLIFSTILTLLVIPCLYKVSDDVSGKLRFFKSRRNGRNI